MAVKHMAIVCVLLLGACSSESEPARSAEASGSGTIVVTDPDLRCLVERIMPAGTPLVLHGQGDDPRALRDALLIIATGNDRDAWLDLLPIPPDRILRVNTFIEDDLITLDVLTHSHGPSGEHSHAIIAPNAWYDPRLATRVLSGLTQRLSEADAQSLAGGLDALDRSLGAGASRTLIMTSNDAWRYFARRAGAPILVVRSARFGARLRASIEQHAIDRIVILEGPRAEDVRVVVGDRAIDVLEPRLPDGACAWIDRLETAARSLTDLR